MCFSQFAQFEPRPTFEEAVPAATRPEGAPPTQAEQDPNLYGPIPMPPEWRVEATEGDNGHHAHAAQHVHEHVQVQDRNVISTPAATVAAVNTNGGSTAAITGVSTQTVEAVVVELSNGTRLLICPL